MFGYVNKEKQGKKEKGLSSRLENIEGWLA